MYKFEILPQSWSKRRKITETIREVIDFEVIDFVKESNHRCQLSVKFDDGETILLDARVYVNRTHRIEDDGSVTDVETGWGVQGTNPHGVSVVLRLVE